MIAERVFLAAMALGLVLIGQPWSHVLFVAGFPLVLAGLVAYNVASWFGPPGSGQGGGP